MKNTILRNKGIKTVEKFFNTKLAKELPPADLVIANNVLAHVPDINDFLKGMKNILNKEGIISIEFPHLLNLRDDYPNLCKKTYRHVHKSHNYL